MREGEWIKILCLSIAGLFLAILVTCEVKAQSRAVPDDSLTPGDVRTGGAREAPRPSLDRKLLAELRHKYGLAPGQKPAEWDHRIPWGCFGATSALNLWPQSAPAKQEKDKLEHWFEAQIRAHKRTVQDCQTVFKGDWRAYYRLVYKHEPKT